MVWEVMAGSLTPLRKSNFEEAANLAASALAQLTSSGRLLARLASVPIEYGLGLKALLVP